MFDYIENIRDIREVLIYNKEFSEYDRGDYTAVDYNYVSNTTFKTSLAIECRGISFDKNTGDIIQRPLHKFFNLGEKDWLNVNDMNIDKPYKVYDKLDGSMIAISKYHGELLIKTRATHENSQSIAVTKLLKDRGLYDKLYEFMDDDHTFIFEYTSPDNMVVVHYKTDELTLLAVRNNRTGVYLEIHATLLGLFFEQDVGLPIVRMRMMPLRDILETINSETESEGYVIRDPDTHTWFKIKNDWYCGLHKSISMLRVRDIAELVLDGTIDDFKAKLKLADIDISEIEKIEKKVMNSIRITQRMVEKVTSNGSLIYGWSDPKGFALHHKDHELFGLLMNQYRGIKNNYIEWYRRNKLKMLPLDSVGVTYIKDKK